MDNQEIRETAVWKLFEKGRDYHRRTGIYTDTDRNYRMYNGDQWEGVKLGDVEPIQKNFIRPIVRYKVAVVPLCLETSALALPTASSMNVPWE